MCRTLLGAPGRDKVIGSKGSAQEITRMSAAADEMSADRVFGEIRITPKAIVSGEASYELANVSGLRLRTSPFDIAWAIVFAAPVVLAVHNYVAAPLIFGWHPNWTWSETLILPICVIAMIFMFRKIDKECRLTASLVTGDSVTVAKGLDRVQGRAILAAFSHAKASIG